jgi:itaconate CoA-transferase
MLESLVEWMGYPMYYTFDNQSPPPRAGAAHSTIYPYGPFATGDGNSVMLGLQNEREWALFCEQVLGAPELTDDPRFASNSERSAHREALRALIHEAFADLTAEDAIARLDAVGIANARVNDMAGVWAHPQLAARERWRDIGSPEGALPALLPPAVNRNFEPCMGEVPGLGEHTRATLAGLGYDEATINRLRDAGAI